jgi:EpsG family
MKKRTGSTSSLSVIYGWLLFIAWPFGVLLLSANNFSNKGYRFFILLFFAFFGYTFINNNPGLDSYVHKLKFEDVAKKPTSELYVILNDFVNFQGDELDIYVPIVNFVVSRFTNDSGFVFALHALVFGFFYLKCIAFLYDEFKGKINKNAMLFMILFATLYSVHQINAVRYYTAIWIWTYGALHILSKRDLRFLVYCLAASLVHFGITPMTGVLLIFYILGPRNNIYVPLVFITFIIGNFFPLDIFVKLGTSVSSAAEARAESYTNMDVHEQREEVIKQAAWFIQWRAKALHGYIIIALSYVYFNRKSFKWDVKQEYLLSATIFFLSFINLVIDVPSFGGRMRFVFWLIAAYFFYRLFQLNPQKKLQNIVIAGIIPVLLWAAVEFRISTEFTNIIAVAGDPFFLLFDKNDISVYDIIFKR